MKNIKMPLYHRFKNGEIIQHMNMVIDLFKGYDLVALKLDNLVAELESEVSKMNELFMQHRAVTLRAEIQPLDDRRIKNLRAIRLFMEFEINRGLPERVPHAQKLIRSYKKIFSGIDDMTLQNKTATINKFVKMWTSNEEFKTSLAALGAEYLLDEVKAVNDNLYNNYFAKVKPRPVEGPAGAKRDDVKAAYENLISYTNSFALVSPDKETYVSILSGLHSLNQDSKITVVSRTSKKKKNIPKPSDIPREATGL